MIYENLHKDMVNSLKSGDKSRANALRTMIAQIQKIAIDKGCRDNILDTLAEDELLKIKKSIQEQIDTCPADRNELLDKYKFEMTIVNEYAPVVVSDQAVIRQKILDWFGSKTLRGDQRGAAMKAFKNSDIRYDMRVVNHVISSVMEG